MSGKPIITAKAPAIRYLIIGPVACSAGGFSKRITGPMIMRSTPIANRAPPNFDQPDAGLPCLAGCWLAWPNCAPQFGQNPDPGGILAPQYGQNVTKGVPQPAQNLCPATFCVPHLGHISICCISYTDAAFVELYDYLPSDSIPVDVFRILCRNDWTGWDRLSGLPLTLVPEMAHSSENHSHIILIGCGDHLFISY